MKHQFERVDELIRENGGVLVRMKRHPVYRFPNGQQFVHSATPGDRRAAMNSMSVLRRILAAQSERKTQ